MRKITFYFPILLLMSFYWQGNAQYIDEDFQGVWPPTDWLLVNNSTGHNWNQNTHPSFSIDGNSAQYNLSLTEPADAWLFTKAVALNAGETVSWSFYERVREVTYPENLRFTVGMEQTVAAQTTVLIDLPGLTNIAFTQQSGVFTAISTGTYYFALNCYSPENRYDLFVDDLLIEAITLTGSLCEDPIIINNLPFTTSDNTLNYGDDYSSGACNNYYMGGDDVFYSFTPDEDMTVDFTLGNLDKNYTGIHIMDACIDASPNCVAFEGNLGSSDRILNDIALIGGTTYYIAISSWPAPQSFTYDLTITDSSLGLAYSIIEGFKMFPNPASNTLHLNASRQIDAINIYNMLGQEVLRKIPSQTQVRLDISNLQTGAYVVKVQAGDQLGSYTLIKQ